MDPLSTRMLDNGTRQDDDRGDFDDDFVTDFEDVDDLIDMIMINANYS